MSSAALISLSMSIWSYCIFQHSWLTTVYFKPALNLLALLISWDEPCPPYAVKCFFQLMGSLYSIIMYLLFLSTLISLGIGRYVANACVIYLASHGITIHRTHTFILYGYHSWISFCSSRMLLQPAVLQYNHHMRTLRWVSTSARQKLVTVTSS